MAGVVEQNAKDALWGPTTASAIHAFMKQKKQPQRFCMDRCARHGVTGCHINHAPSPQAGARETLQSFPGLSFSFLDQASYVGEHATRDALRATLHATVSKQSEHASEKLLLRAKFLRSSKPSTKTKT
eukprot:3348562-Amphidinium_carterae.2